MAYATVALSFLVLRKKEPEMERPFKVRNGKIVGWAALLLSLGLIVLYCRAAPPP